MFSIFNHFDSVEVWRVSNMTILAAKGPKGCRPAGCQKPLPNSTTKLPPAVLPDDGCTQETCAMNQNWSTDGSLECLKVWICSNFFNTCFNLLQPVSSCGLAIETQLFCMKRPECKKKKRDKPNTRLDLNRTFGTKTEEITIKLPVEDP